MSGDSVELRKRAEQRLYRRRDSEGASSPTDVLAAELEVHRVELDMQREEIEQQRDEALASRNRYAALCDLAPVALLVIDTYSHILDANTTAWQLLGLHHRYEHDTDLLLYLEWASATKLRAALSRGVSTTMEVQVQPQRGRPFTALLSLARAVESAGAFQIAITATSSFATDDRCGSVVSRCEPEAATILIVEPYAPGRRALRDNLDELGYNLIDVEDKADALRIAPEVSPATVIADYQPGQADSLALLDALRARWPELPAVLLCANRERVAEVPPRAILLPKPVAVEDLERAITSLIPSAAGGVPGPRP